MQAQELSTLSIRPFTAADYDVVAHLHGVSFPEFSMTADEWRFEDERRPAHCRSARWVADWDGHVVGFAQYDQHAGHYHPRKFELHVVVDPAFWLRGIGRRLYELVLGELRGLEPLSVDVWSREDMTYRVGFFERRGFVEDMRLWTSALDLKTFDPTRFAHHAPVVAAQGIRIQSLAELGPTDPAVQRKLYDVWLEIRRDVPHPPDDTLVDVSFERHLERFARPNLLPAGFFVAIDGEQFVGATDLSLCAEPGVLRTGLTGVRRGYRRRGIAFALKVRSLEFAQAAGYRCVQTENELNNHGMVAINDEIGFAKNPAWVHYLKSFED
jgi:GNAT superfamily N-acetyltransferase